jgi:hypothetical protein
MTLKWLFVCKRLLAYYAGKFIFLADKYVICFIYRITFRLRNPNKEENDFFGK